MRDVVVVGGQPAVVDQRLVEVGTNVPLTRIDIDEDTLSKAVRLSGAKTKKDTVNLALREFAAPHRRVVAGEHSATLAAGWDFDGWQHRRAAK